MNTLNLEQLSQDLENTESILSSLLGIGSLAITGMGALISLIVAVVGGLISIAYYLLQSIPLFIMARKAGCRHAWMAFFPYTNDYLSFILPIREFNLFNWIKSNRRDYMALIYLGLLLFGTSVVALVTFLTAYIPIVGPLVATFGGTALTFFTYSFKWRMYYDLLITFGMKEHALWVSIVSLFIPWVFMIFSVFACKNPPEYGKGNYYMYRAQN